MPHEQVIVDGNNLLHAWRAPDGRPRGAFPEVRWALVRHLERLAGDIGAHILVVFDGTIGGRDEALSRGAVEVVFAPRELSADLLIERQVRAAPDPRAVLVVTSDQAIQRAVTSVGAEAMSCPRFLEWVNERAQAMSASLRRGTPAHKRPRLGDFFPPASAPGLLLALMALTLLGARPGHAQGDAVARVNNGSPAFLVPAEAVAHHMSYTAYAYTNGARTSGTRLHHEGIGPKVLEMIAAADTHIILSVFLFDNFYAEAPAERDVVGVLTQALLARKAANPAMRIALILDPSHAAYGSRVSPAEAALRAGGVDVFYSDLLEDLKKAGAVGAREGMGHTGRVLDRVTLNAWGNARSAVMGMFKLPGRFDDEQLSLESAYNATLLKANHRKVLVCDVHGQDWEALVATANPHNASAFHVNAALSVRGQPARYLYNLLREDMRQSAGLGRRFAHWHAAADRAYRRGYLTQAFPVLPLAPIATPADPSTAGHARVRVVTESAIRDAIIAMLEDVHPNDEIRIQMFYLSFQPVLDALLEASRVVKTPIRLLLDANKDSFNKEKDGTPNRQVARYLLREARRLDGLIEIRWYATHGEQNHAKSMSITNPHLDRHLFTTGSANWTGRNLDGVNMEVNLVVRNAPAVNADFNALFDRFWTNADQLEYSLPYEAFNDIAPDFHWRRGEKPWYLGTF